MIPTYFVKPNGIVLNCKTQHTKYLYDLVRNSKKYENFWNFNKEKYVYIKDAFAYELKWIGVSIWYGNSIKIDDCIKPTKQQLVSIFNLVKKHNCGYQQYVNFIDKWFK